MLSPFLTAKPHPEFSLKQGTQPHGAQPRRFRVFSTENSEYFAQELVFRLGGGYTPIVRQVFGDGERYYRVDIKDRQELVGLDAVIVSAATSDTEILEIFRVGCELASLGTRRRIFVIPFLGYSTMERAVKPGEIVTAKANARLLSAIPNCGLGNTFMFCDLHVNGIMQYFEGSCQCMELYTQRFLVEKIQEHIISRLAPGEEIVFGSADLGRPLWVESFANTFHTSIAFIRKTRNMESTRVIGTPIGDVRDKTVIIYDDMTRSGHTLINAAESYLAAGARKIMAVLSHLAFCNESIIDTIEQSCIALVISTNSHPMSQHPKVQSSPKFVIADITDVFKGNICASYIQEELSSTPSP